MRPNWLLKTVYCGAFTCGWTRRHDEKGLRCVTTKAPLFADKTRWKHLHCGDEWRRLWQAQDGHFRLGNARKTSRRNSRWKPTEALERIGSESGGASFTGLGAETDLGSANAARVA